MMPANFLLMQHPRLVSSLPQPIARLRRKKTGYSCRPSAGIMPEILKALFHRWEIDEAGCESLRFSDRFCRGWNRSGRNENPPAADLGRGPAFSSHLVHDVRPGARKHLGVVDDEICLGHFQIDRGLAGRLVLGVKEFLGLDTTFRVQAALPAALVVLPVESSIGPR